jgi:hypothetical protein
MIRFVGLDDSQKTVFYLTILLYWVLLLEVHMPNTTAELECSVPAAHPAGEVLFPRRGRPPKKDPTPLSSAMATRSITLNLPAYLVEQLHEVAQRELSSGSTLTFLSPV